MSDRAHVGACAARSLTPERSCSCSPAGTRQLLTSAIVCGERGMSRACRSCPRPRSSRRARSAGPRRSCASFGGRPAAAAGEHDDERALDAVRQPGRQDVRQPALADLGLRLLDVIGDAAERTLAAPRCQPASQAARGSPSRGWPTEPGFARWRAASQIERRAAGRDPARERASRPRRRRARRGCVRRARAAPRSRAGRAAPPAR